eukprot:c15534_g1_i2 orf=428-805(+)
MRCPTNSDCQRTGTDNSNPFDPPMRELVANFKSSFAEVEVKVSGPNALLKAMSQKASGQVLRLVTELEKLSLEIMHLNITTVEDTVLYAFTLKIGIECQLGVDDLAAAVHQTFSEIHSRIQQHPR